ncbi:hypothetical protein HK097_001257 [Rhizophlyctis rosea]|uniref:RRP12-like protein n=1 Tax=Rhizophlyctis rosea TaxID=64517 RepID=A0AAD5X0W9_9FUNG|nr:hypothetical protein HK097_001257 [Rhizophlyctis rosea]
MMVCAGFAGTGSGMQSGAMSSLARLVFEFHDQMEDELLEELVSTVLMFMDSKNREIVKAALGFVKVAVVTLTQELLEENLENIVVSILTHSRDHKSHFKSKVRHIFERLVRKFSYEAIEGFVPESDRKLIINIKKRRDRIKKQKAQARKMEIDGDAQPGSDDDEVAALARKGKKAAQAQVEEQVRGARQKAFEDALHGSESELESGDEDEEGGGDEQWIPEQYRGDLVGKSAGKGKGQGKTMIREDGEVVDFLDRRVVSRVTSGGERKRKGRKEDAKVDEDGKLIFEESGDEDDGPGGSLATGEAMDTEDYYKQSLKSEAALIGTPDGRVKFVNKRKRDEDDEEGDDGLPSITGTGVGWKQGAMGKGKKDKGIDEGTMAKMLGKQYKAKRAKGDVKKAGMPDPYAYIPLNSKTVGGPKRKSAKAAGTFKNIVAAAQKGSEVGSKAGHKGGFRKGNKRHK